MAPRPARDCESFDPWLGVEAALDWAASSVLLSPHTPESAVLTPARLAAVYGVAVAVERLADGRTVGALDLD